MKKLTLLLSIFFCLKAYSQTGIYTTEMAECDTLITDFMANWGIPGLTMALSKDGKLVYHRAFGHADVAGTETTYPYHLFRTASNSKPITSIAVMKMYEDGLLNLSDKVFGPGGILENHPLISGANITDNRIYDITVQNLLEHLAGWDRNLDCYPNPTSPYPWWFSGCDPLVAPLHIADQNGTTNPIVNEDNIIFLLEKGLDFTPGTGYAYSNVGFIVLGEIIEELSGTSYEDYVTTQILEPVNACDIVKGKNLLTDKREREGEYVGNGGTTLDCYGNGTTVSYEYGGLNLESFEAPSIWIANPRDYCRLLVAVDNFASVPDILSSSTITTMTTPSSQNANYAKGWSVNAAGNWWHFGSLPGTVCFIARTSGGYTWTLIMNKRIIGASAAAFWNDVDALPWSCLAATTSYPTFDLFATPTVSASDIKFTVIDNNSCQMDWMSGDGDNRIVVAKQGSPVDMFPVDGTSYTANAAFGNGTDIGNNNYVIYDGDLSTVNISNLMDGEKYYFRVFEYNDNATTGNHKLYLLPKSESIEYYSGCMDNLVLSEYYQNLYKATMNIQADACINNMDIIFQAGQTIELLSDFCTENNNSFEAIIQTCN